MAEVQASNMGYLGAAESRGMSLRYFPCSQQYSNMGFLRGGEAQFDYMIAKVQ